MGCRIDVFTSVRTLISLYISIKAPGWPGELSISSRILKEHFFSLNTKVITVGLKYSVNHIVN